VKARKTLGALIAVTLLAAAASLVSAGTKADPQAVATVFQVNSTGDESDVAPGNGVCETAPGNGVCTLRAAIQEVIARHTATDAITIPNSISGPGCSGGVCTITLATALPSLSVPVTITGPGANQLTVMRSSAAGNFRIFNVTANGTVSFSDLTISNGVAASTPGGGGINNNGATVNVTRCTLTNNRAGDTGGAIHNFLGTVTVTASMLMNNSAADGGGIASDGGGGAAVNISYSTITNNTANVARGGGIAVNSSALSISNSTVSFNTSDDSGGGLSIINTTASANVTNCTIWGNTAAFLPGGSAGGGGIFNQNNTSNATVLTNCTIGNNHASNGNHCGGVYNALGPVTARNTIIAVNMTNSGGPPDVEGAFTSQGFNLIGDGTGSTGFTNNVNGDKVGSSAAAIDPKLDTAPAANGGPTKTVALLVGSPAIDAGNDANAPTGDQRNYVRVGTSDIGAFEFGGTFARAVSRKIHGAATAFTENFDGVTAPALPTGWTATNAQGLAPLWSTSTVAPASPPNSAFINDPPSISDKRLESPSIFIPAAGYQLSFQNFYNLNNNLGQFHSGGVLEISINGGAYNDITTAGPFGIGGYNVQITGSGNPLIGRMAWGGNSFGGYIPTVVDFGSGVVGQSIKLRWRMGSDNSGMTFPGWWIDNVSVAAPGTPFDVPLPLAGTVGIECRRGSGANSDGHQVVVTFGSTVTGGSVTVVSVNGMATGTASAAGTEVTVTLSSVTNAQTININLNNVSDGISTYSFTIPMGVLAGDTTANGSVNSSDIAQTQSQSGQPVTSSNFREDVTVNGSINSSDIAFVQAKSGTGLPVATSQSGDPTTAPKHRASSGNSF
jgi:CSLREA domain-containing protein